MKTSPFGLRKEMFLSVKNINAYFLGGYFFKSIKYS